MRRYNSQAVLPQPIKKEISLSAISAETELVSLEKAVEILHSKRGLKLSVKTIREYCRSGKWLNRYHWVKPGKTYLINMKAVFETIASERQSV